MRQEVRRLEGDVERRQLQLEELQGAYDDVLERLKGQSASLVAALGTGAMAGGADDVLSQVSRCDGCSAATCTQLRTCMHTASHLPAYSSAPTYVQLCACTPCVSLFAH